MSDTGTNINGGQPVVATPPTNEPVVSNDLEKTKAEVETIKQSLLEAQQKITELSTENSSLVQRIDEVETREESVPAVTPANTTQLDSVVRLAQTDPALAIEQIGKMMEQAKTETEKRILEKTRRETESLIIRQNAIQEVRQIVKEKGFGDWEDEIALHAQHKINTLRMPMKKAVEDSIVELGKKIAKKTQTPFVETPLPSGAIPTTGANAPPVGLPAETPVETREDYVTKREKERLKRIKFA